MADESRYRYCGPKVTPTETKAAAGGEPSKETAIDLIRKAWLFGRVHPTEHFRKQGKQRSFTMLDAQRVIETGNIRGEPERCTEFNNLKYKLIAEVEERTLEIVLAARGRNSVFQAAFSC